MFDIELEVGDTLCDRNEPVSELSKINNYIKKLSDTINSMEDVSDRINLKIKLASLRFKKINLRSLIMENRTRFKLEEMRIAVGMKELQLQLNEFMMEVNKHRVGGKSESRPPAQECAPDRKRKRDSSGDPPSSTVGKRRKESASTDPSASSKSSRRDTSASGYHKCKCRDQSRKTEKSSSKVTSSTKIVDTPKSRPSVDNKSASTSQKAVTKKNVLVPTDIFNFVVPQGKPKIYGANSSEKTAKQAKPAPEKHGKVKTSNKTESVQDKTQLNSNSRKSNDVQNVASKNALDVNKTAKSKRRGHGKDCLEKSDSKKGRSELKSAKVDKDNTSKSKNSDGGKVKSANNVVSKENLRENVVEPASNVNLRQEVQGIEINVVVNRTKTVAQNPKINNNTAQNINVGEHNLENPSTSTQKSKDSKPATEKHGKVKTSNKTDSVQDPRNSSSRKSSDVQNVASKKALDENKSAKSESQGRGKDGFEKADSKKDSAELKTSKADKDNNSKSKNNDGGKVKSANNSVNKENLSENVVESVSNVCPRQEGQEIEIYNNVVANGTETVAQNREINNNTAQNIYVGEHNVKNPSTSTQKATDSNNEKYLNIAKMIVQEATVQNAKLNSPDESLKLYYPEDNAEIMTKIKSERNATEGVKDTKEGSAEKQLDETKMAYKVVKKEKKVIKLVSSNVKTNDNVGESSTLAQLNVSNTAESSTTDSFEAVEKDLSTLIENSFPRVPLVYKRNATRCRQSQGQRRRHRVRKSQSSHGNSNNNKIPRNLLEALPGLVYTNIDIQDAIKQEHVNQTYKYVMFNKKMRPADDDCVSEHSRSSVATLKLR